MTCERFSEPTQLPLDVTVWTDTKYLSKQVIKRTPVYFFQSSFLVPQPCIGRRGLDDLRSFSGCPLSRSRPGFLHRATSRFVFQFVRLLDVMSISFLFPFVCQALHEFLPSRASVASSSKTLYGLRNFLGYFPKEKGNKNEKRYGGML